MKIKPYQQEKIIIIGAGPAGVAAAVQAKRLEINPVLLDTTGTAGGLVANGFCIENYPGLEKSICGRDFAQRLNNHLKKFEISVIKQHVLNIVKQNDGWLINTNKTDYLAQNVILSTGTKPKTLNIHEESKLVNNKHLFYELNQLLKVIEVNNQTIIVVGAGEAALDYALSLAGKGALVKILIRNNKVKAMGRLVNMVMQQSQIELIFNSQISAINSIASNFDKLIVEVKNQNNSIKIKCDAVIAAVGRVGNIGSLSKDFDDLRPLSLTPVPGLFICGDARLGSLGQVAIAVGDGLAAAGKAVERTIKINMKLKR